MVESMGSLNVRSGSEEEDHYEGVWEADFGPVDESVAQALEESEDVMVGGIQDEGLDRSLRTGC